MKIIVLHDRYSNDTIIVQPDAIKMIRKGKEDGEEYSNIVAEGFSIDIKETIREVMVKIKNAESEGEG